MIDVAAAIDLEAVDWAHKRIAAASGTWVNGKWVPGAASTVTIKAVVQPSGGRPEMMDLPEGIRDEAERVAWTRTELKLTDELTRNGRTYRVIHVWDRSDDGSHYKAALGRVKL